MILAQAKEGKELCLAPGQLLEIRKREKRQQSLHEQHKDCLDQLQGGLLEIGCGHGHWLAAYAESHPGQTCIGLDLIQKRIDKSNSKARKRSLKNVHFIKAEALEFLELIPDYAGIQTVMILFPDPWPKKRHHRRRLIQSSFLSLLARKMAPDGRLYFRTDHSPYFDWTVEQLRDHEDWTQLDSYTWPLESNTYFQILMGGYQSLAARVRKTQVICDSHGGQSNETRVSQSF